MSFNNETFYQLRSWEFSLVNDSPEGKNRYIVVEAGRGGMKVIVVDRWHDQHGNTVSRNMFETSFWPDDCVRRDGFRQLPCAPEDDSRVICALRMIDKVADAKEEIQSLFYTCFILPQALSSTKGWLSKYAPEFFEFHEQVIVSQQLQNVQEVLDA